MDIQDLVRGVRNKLPEAQEELYKIRDKKAVPILVAALKDSDSVVRYTVTKVLGFIKDERAIEPLIDRMLHDNDDDVRAKAVESLGMIGSKRATESMLITMKSSTLRIR